MTPQCPPEIDDRSAGLPGPPAARASNSVGHLAGWGPWLRESAALFGMRLQGLKQRDLPFTELFDEIAEYRARYAELAGAPFEAARIVEIGYGARPNRLLALISMGCDARGIDLDRPILRGSPAEFLEIHRRNGPRRAFKSFVRHVLFDRHERNALRRALQVRGRRLAVVPERFLVGDAGDARFEPGSVDLVYSEDVFEHIPPESLHRLCRSLAEALSPRGIALISPAIHTGIAGGHLVEWYPHTLALPMQRRTEAWEHLRRRRTHADCYLNELRVHEFEALFREYFDVVRVVNRDPGMGREHLTPAVRDELGAYSEDELLSHKWTFVLRRKPGGPA